MLTKIIQAFCLLIMFIVMAIFTAAGMTGIAYAAGSGAVDLPKTGQTTCYDVFGNVIACSGTGQDGDIQAGVAWPSPRFTNNGNGTVTDKLTGLIWLRNGNCFNSLSWANALNAANTLNSSECGLMDGSVEGDWRLPNANELESLIHAGYNTAGWLNGQGFSNVQGWEYWTSTNYYPYSPRTIAWTIMLSNGYVDGDVKTDSYSYVLPVRGATSLPAKVWQTGQTECFDALGVSIDCQGTGQDGEIQAGTAWTEPRFTDNGNGTGTDKLTGLIWLKNADCFGNRQWANAISDANNLADGQCGLTDGSSAGDWRLPNKNELTSMMGYETLGNMWDVFTNIGGGEYWSSTTFYGNAHYAWKVGIWGTSAKTFNKTDAVHVWPVRDLLPPSSPSYFSAKPISSTQIVLSWQDNSKNETGFRIQRKNGDCSSLGSWAQIAVKGADATAHTNSNLTPDTRYSYRVRAYNAEGISEWSTCKSAATAKAGTPNAPANMKAVSKSTSQIDLTWTDKSADETSFKIYKKIDSGAWGLLASLNADITNYSDTAATGNKTTAGYSYKMKSCNSAGCSPETSVAEVPFAPTGLKADNVTSNQVNMSWVDASSNETGFEIWRKTGSCSSGGWTLIFTTAPDALTFSDAPLTSSTTYSYKVRASSDSTSAPYSRGVSVFTNCIGVLTP